MDDGKIFKVDTVPPPDGESDAYSAPTRVGPINADEWAALMEAQEARNASGSGSQRARNEPMTVSERSARVARDVAAPRPIDIPPPAPLPEITVPNLDVHDSGDDQEGSWPDLGDAALEALESSPRVSSPLSLPPSRPSVFPEWVAGENVQEKAAFEEARRRKLKTLMGACIVVTLALGGLVAAVLRH